MKVFNLFPNWADGISVKYAHNTTVFTSTSQKEQRASIRIEPLRTVTFRIFDNSFPVTSQINDLLSTIRTEIAVPIFSEPFTILETGDIYGQTVLTICECPHHFNFFNYGGAFAIYDLRGILPPEFKYVISNPVGSVTTTTVEGHFLAEHCICYPVIVGYLIDAPGIQHITNELSEFDVVFSEKRSLTVPVDLLAWQDSDEGLEYQDSDVGTEYQNI